MIINTCKFIEASELFKDCDEIFNAFVECDPECVWGSNNRTLVTKDVITDALDKIIDRSEPPYTTEDDVELDTKKVEDFFLRLDALEDDVYIDLEN